MGMVYDQKQSGNIYYKFLNLLSTPFTFEINLHGVRLR